MLNPKDPSTLAAAWLAVPLLVATASAGLGVGIRLLSGWSLGVLTVPAGYLAGIALVTAGLQLDVDVTLLVVGCLALAVAGPAVLLVQARRRGLGLGSLRGWRPPPVALWAGGAALVAYGIAILPEVGSGRSAVVGYLLNNDNALHVTLIESIAQHGARPVDVASDSFFRSTSELTTGYPLGAYAWPLVGRVALGIEPIHLWNPLIALTAAMLALVAFSVLRSLSAPAPFAAVAGAIVPGAYLLYAFSAQSGAKELLVSLTVVGAIVLAAKPFEDRVTGRSLIPAAIASAAAVANFGVTAGVWLAPAGGLLLALLVARAVRVRDFGELKSVGLYAVVAVPIGLPAVLNSLDFFTGNEQRFGDPNDIGNLLGALPQREIFGIWLSEDYRFGRPDYPFLTDVGVVLAAAVAVAGLAYCVYRRRLALPIALVASVVASLLVYPRTSIYYESKTLVPLAAVVAIVIAAGVLALLRSRRLPSWLGLGVGAVLALGVLASDALVYAGTWLTPKERFQELSDINERFAGHGRTLFVDREQWGVYLLRDTGVWDDWGDRQPLKGIAYASPPSLPHAPEFDDYLAQHFHRFNLLVERKRPGGSLPPGNFTPAYETKHYRVWRRTGPDPAVHLAVGRRELSGTRALPCESGPVASLLAEARRRGSKVRVAWREDAPVRVVPTDAWIAFEPARYIAPPPLVSREGGVAARTVTLPRGHYNAWLQGLHGPGVRLFARQAHVGDVTGDPALPSQWKPVGTFESDGDPITFTISSLDRPWMLSGSDQSDQTGPLVVEATEPRRGVTKVSPSEFSRFCGKQVDWLEIQA